MQRGRSSMTKRSMKVKIVREQRRPAADMFCANCRLVTVIARTGVTMGTASHMKNTIRRNDDLQLSKILKLESNLS